MARRDALKSKISRGIEVGNKDQRPVIRPVILDKLHQWLGIRSLIQYELLLQRNTPLKLKRAIRIPAPSWTKPTESRLQSPMQLAPICATADCHRKSGNVHSVLPNRSLRKDICPIGYIHSRRCQKIDFVCVAQQTGVMPRERFRATDDALMITLNYDSDSAHKESARFELRDRDNRSMNFISKIVNTWKHCSLLEGYRCNS